MGKDCSSALWPIEGSIWGYSQWQHVTYETVPSKDAINDYLDKANLSRYQELSKKDTWQNKQEYDDFLSLRKKMSTALEFTVFPGIVDKSSLKKGSGTAYAYGVKPFAVTHIISSLCIATQPLYLVGTVAYNILRILPVTLYILGCLLYESHNGKQIFAEDRKFKARDITDQIGVSLWNIARSPYYCLGYLFGLLYSLISPLNGRKVVAGFERQWNSGIHRYRGIWMTMGPQREFKLEGGGAPSALGEHAFYIPGCYQPFATVIYENGKAIKATSVSERTTYQNFREYSGSCIWPEF